MNLDLITEKDVRLQRGKLRGWSIRLKKHTYNFAHRDDWDKVLAWALSHGDELLQGEGEAE